MPETCVGLHFATFCSDSKSRRQAFQVEGGFTMDMALPKAAHVFNLLRKTWVNGRAVYLAFDLPNRKVSPVVFFDAFSINLAGQQHGQRAVVHVFAPDVTYHFVLEVVI